MGAFGRFLPGGERNNLAARWKSWCPASRRCDQNDRRRYIWGAGASV